MATVHDILERAYRKVGIIAHDDAMTADHAAAGLNTFNDMLHSWELVGIALGHTDVGLSDAFPLADKFREGAVYLLASRLAPDWSVPVAFDAYVFLREIQASYMVIDTVALDPMLVRNSVI